MRRIDKVVIKTSDKTLSDNYYFGSNPEQIIDVDTGVSLEDFVRNFRQYMRENFYVYKSDTRPTNPHTGIWVDTSLTNQEGYPTYPFVHSATFVGNGGTWIDKDKTVDSETKYFTTDFLPGTPAGISNSGNILIGWYQQIGNNWVYCDPTKLEGLSGETFTAQWAPMTLTMTPEVFTVPAGKEGKVKISLTIGKPIEPTIEGLDSNFSVRLRDLDVIISEDLKYKFVNMHYENGKFTTEVTFDIAADTEVGKNYTISCESCGKKVTSTIVVGNVDKYVVTPKLKNIITGGVTFSVPTSSDDPQVYPDITKDNLAFGKVMTGHISYNNIECYMLPEGNNLSTTTSLSDCEIISPSLLEGTTKKFSTTFIPLIITDTSIKKFREQAYVKATVTSQEDDMEIDYQLVLQDISNTGRNEQLMNEFFDNLDNLAFGVIVTF